MRPSTSGRGTSGGGNVGGRADPDVCCDRYCGERWPVASGYYKVQEQDDRYSEASSSDMVEVYIAGLHTLSHYNQM